MSLLDSATLFSLDNEKKLRLTGAFRTLENPLSVMFFGDLTADEIERIKSEISGRWLNGNKILFYYFYIDKYLDVPDVHSVSLKELTENKSSLVKIRETYSSTAGKMFDTVYSDSKRAEIVTISYTADSVNLVMADVVMLFYEYLKSSGIGGVYSSAIQLFSSGRRMSHENADVVKAVAGCYESWKSEYSGLFTENISARHVFRHIYFIDERNSGNYNYNHHNEKISLIADLVYSDLLKREDTGYFNTAGVLKQRISDDYLILKTACILNRETEKIRQSDIKSSDGTSIRMDIKDFTDSAGRRFYHLLMNSIKGNAVRRKFSLSSIISSPLDVAEEVVFGTSINDKYEFLVQKYYPECILNDSLAEKISRMNSVAILEDIINENRQTLLALSPVEIKRGMYVESNLRDETAFGDALENQLISQKYSILIENKKTEIQKKLLNLINSECRKRIDEISDTSRTFNEFSQASESAFSNVGIQWGKWTDENKLDRQIFNIISDAEHLGEYFALAVKSQKSQNFSDLIQWVYEKFASKIKVSDIILSEDVSLSELPVYCNLRISLPNSYAEETIDCGGGIKKRLKSVSVHPEETTYLKDMF